VNAIAIARRPGTAAVEQLLARPWSQLSADERAAVRSWYAGHLRSTAWLDFREAVLAAVDRCCERCGHRGTARHGGRVLQLQHRSYVNLGAERWPRDVEVACEFCRRAEDASR
jgi:hypothetical protein